MKRALSVLLLGTAFGCSTSADDRKPGLDADVATPDSGTCGVTPTTVRSCLARDRSAWSANNGRGRHTDLQGTVSVVGAEPSECEVPMIGRTVRPGPSGDAWSFRVTDASGPASDVQVWVHAEGVQAPVQPGDQVRVEYLIDTSEFDQMGRGGLTVRSSGGTLLLWSGEATDVGRLPVPDELTVQLGDPACVVRDEGGCGTVELSRLQVKLDGETLDLGYGERGELAGYLVIHAGQEQLAEWEGCADWEPAHTALLVARLPL
jgi:hypothetical protein